ncbi:MAG: slipin family protein [Chloroflexi bacterium]|nr:slipin family protein [Chloroflexota bacterium]MCL5274539.1 slipin family protein [Chloroflexota bacterium]
MTNLTDQLKRSKPAMDPKQSNPVALALFIIIVFIGFQASRMTGQFENGATATWMLLSFIPALYVLFALKIASPWEKAVTLRMGKFVRLAGPGAFWIVPVVETVPIWIDQRVMVTSFSAEKTLTKDTVPINVDAVLFWVVWDAQKAALEVENYRNAIAWSAQTALRDIIGKMVLADILVGREMIDTELQKVIDQRTTPWGVSVQSVEIRDIVIPSALEDAMSRQAQAERERQARVILGDAERQIAESFRAAADVYGTNMTALHLRAMNMLFEGLKERGAMVIVPSSAVETMGLGGLSGLTSLARSVGGAGAAQH